MIPIYPPYRGGWEGGGCINTVEPLMKNHQARLQKTDELPFTICTNDTFDKPSQNQAWELEKSA